MHVDDDFAYPSSSSPPQPKGKQKAKYPRKTAQVDSANISELRERMINSLGLDEFTTAQLHLVHKNLRDAVSASFSNSSYTRAREFLDLDERIIKEIDTRNQEAELRRANTTTKAVQQFDNETSYVVSQMSERHDKLLASFEEIWSEKIQPQYFEPSSTLQQMKRDYEESEDKDPDLQQQIEELEETEQSLAQTNFETDYQQSYDKLRSKQERELKVYLQERANKKKLLLIKEAPKLKSPMKPTPALIYKRSPSKMPPLLSYTQGAHKKTPIVPLVSRKPKKRTSKSTILPSRAQSKPLPPLAEAGCQSDYPAQDDELEDIENEEPIVIEDSSEVEQKPEENTEKQEETRKISKMDSLMLASNEDLDSLGSARDALDPDMIPHENNEDNNDGQQSNSLLGQFAEAVTQELSEEEKILREEEKIVDESKEIKDEVSDDENEIGNSNSESKKLANKTDSLMLASNEDLDSLGSAREALESELIPREENEEMEHKEEEDKVENENGENNDEQPQTGILGQITGAITQGLMNDDEDKAEQNNDEEPKENVEETNENENEIEKHDESKKLANKTDSLMLASNEDLDSLGSAREALESELIPREENEEMEHNEEEDKIENKNEEEKGDNNDEQPQGGILGIIAGAIAQEVKDDN